MEMTIRVMWIMSILLLLIVVLGILTLAAKKFSEKGEERFCMVLAFVIGIALVLLVVGVVMAFIGGLV